MPAKIFPENECNLMTGLSFVEDEQAFFCGTGPYKPTRFKHFNKLFIVDTKKGTLKHKSEPFDVKAVETMIPQYDLVNPETVKYVGLYLNKKY